MKAIIQISKETRLCDLASVKEAVKEIREDLPSVLQCMTTINQLVTIEDHLRFYHQLLSDTRISDVSLLVGADNVGRVLVTAEFYCRGMVDDIESMFKASNTAVWRNGWIDWADSDLEGDNGDGTAKSTYTFDIFKSTRTKSTTISTRLMVCPPDGLQGRLTAAHCSVEQ